MNATKEQKDELRTKVGKLVRDRFAGDYHQAFDHYDRDVKNGKVSRNELTKLLADADVGTWLSRGIWASRIIEELDTDRDGSISELEFREVMES
jgi:Ca2+-binding EF-hand superfamily protein